MYIENSINLMNLILSLSDALDLVSPFLAQHQMRTAFIAWEIAKELGISSDDIEDLFIASLLHDVGALPPEEKIKIREFEIIDPEPHCIYGEVFLKEVSFFQHASRIVRFHHTPWAQMKEQNVNPLVTCSQILHLADTVERAVARPKYILHQVEKIINLIEAQEDEFCPDLLTISRKFLNEKTFDWIRPLHVYIQFCCIMVLVRIEKSILMNFFPYQSCLEI